MIQLISAAKLHNKQKEIHLFCSVTAKMATTSLAFNLCNSEMRLFLELSLAKQHVCTYMLYLYRILEVLRSSLVVPTVLSAQIQIDGSVPKIDIFFNAKEVMSG